MNDELAEVTIEVLDKPYTIKCPETEITALQQAAYYLDEKMRQLHDDSAIINVEKIAVTAALNVVHQLLDYGNQKARDLAGLQQRVRDLQDKIDDALVSLEETIELQSVV